MLITYKKQIIKNIQLQFNINKKITLNPYLKSFGLFWILWLWKRKFGTFSILIPPLTKFHKYCFRYILQNSHFSNKKEINNNNEHKLFKIYKEDGGFVYVFPLSSYYNATHNIKEEFFSPLNMLSQKLKTYFFTFLSNLWHRSRMKMIRYPTIF